MVKTLITLEFLPAPDRFSCACCHHWRVANGYDPEARQLHIPAGHAYCDVVRRDLHAWLPGPEAYSISCAAHPGRVRAAEAEVPA